jgi:hypothetical protein
MKSEDLDLIEGLEKRLKALEPLLGILESIKPQEFIDASGNLVKATVELKSTNNAILNKQVEINQSVTALKAEIANVKIPEVVKVKNAHDLKEGLFWFYAFGVLVLFSALIVAINFMKYSHITELEARGKYLDSLNRVKFNEANYKWDYDFSVYMGAKHPVELKKYLLTQPTPKN